MLQQSICQSACRNGWFQNKETDYLLSLANEVNEKFLVPSISSLCRLRGFVGLMIFIMCSPSLYILGMLRSRDSTLRRIGYMNHVMLFLIFQKSCPGMNFLALMILSNYLFVGSRYLNDWFSSNQYLP